jgi:predicted TIM-barrel fold metal-dependent hydrolase
VQAQRPQLVDADVHNYPAGMQDFTPYLSHRWQQYVDQSGMKPPAASLYPKMYAAAARRDAWPPTGHQPGSDPDFARQQLLDEWSIDIGVLNPLVAISSLHNRDLANALMRAVNEWTANDWCAADARWRGSICVNARDPVASAREIAHWAGDDRFVQVLLLVRSHAPYGQREFRPIFRAAVEAGLPVGIHFGGGGDVPITACGWPSYYIEDHTAMSQAFETQLVSLVCEGVFSEFADLKVVLIEGGFAWLPALLWRLDKNWRGLRAEVPWLSEPPGQIVRRQVRATTQPMEEPDDSRHLQQILDMIGVDEFLLFSTDYPHWDFDAPDRTLPTQLPEALRRRIFADNAVELYGLA